MYSKKKSPTALIILDGWGHREEAQFNPILKVDTPFIDSLFKNYPNTLILASGEAVGLPKGQMGNSEVGHLHIGAGRKVPQDLTRINQAIKNRDFFKNSTFLKAVNTAKKYNSSIHIVGLLSPGGVHSHEHHIESMVNMLSCQGVSKCYVHALLDGRDSPPQSAMTSLKKLSPHIVSIMGRYYAMDRDHRWQRTQVAYDLLTQGSAKFRADTAEQALKKAYQRGETDEFVKPTLITKEGHAPIILKPNDIVIFMNFRADRARQLTYALTDPKFHGFQRTVIPKLSLFITLTEYANDINATAAFSSIPLNNILGEYIAKQGLTQLRIAETEKYAHVTYFMNGGQEIPFKQEERILIPSPQVATYDMQPEMAAAELTLQLTKAIESKKYDLIICNYANPDMVGHTGNYPAAKKAISVIDTCLHRIVDALKKVDGEAIITADHGNIETMYDEKNHQPHTAHTNNLVPFIYVGKRAYLTAQSGALDDIAPTLLTLLGLPQPQEMTGHSLLALKPES